jgi:hypothetical protein
MGSASTLLKAMVNQTLSGDLMSIRLSVLSSVIAAATVVTACAPGNFQSPGGSAKSSLAGSINAAAIISDKSAPPPVKAQRLADASEQLLSVQGFDYANEVADLALEQDPSNVKAQFVKAILGPIMAQKGIVARVAPLAALDPNGQDQYTEALAQIDAKPNSTLKTFALDGQPDIKNEADVQAHLDAVSNAFGAIRRFAKDNKAASITMNGTDILFQALYQRHLGLCTVTYKETYNYTYSCPSEVAMLQTTIDRGDLEVIQQYAAGMELYLSLYNSYNLTGAITVGQAEATKKGQVLNPKDLMDQLLATPNFGTLRANSGFVKIKSLGADAITGLRWVMANQAKLCPMGSENPRNRIGALVNTGLCVESSKQTQVNNGIRKVEAAMNGAVFPITMQTSAGPTQTTIKPSAILDTPIANLRSLGPVSFSACGKVASLGDGSLGGLFPQKDLNTYLQQDSQKCQ